MDGGKGKDQGMRTDEDRMVGQMGTEEGMWGHVGCGLLLTRNPRIFTFVGMEWNEYRNAVSVYHLPILNYATPHMPYAICHMPSLHPLHHNIRTNLQ